MEWTDSHRWIASYLLLLMSQIVQVTIGTGSEIANPTETSPPQEKNTAPVLKLISNSGLLPNTGGVPCNMAFDNRSLISRLHTIRNLSPMAKRFAPLAKPRRWPLLRTPSLLSHHPGWMSSSIRYPFIPNRSTTSKVPDAVNKGRQHCNLEMEEVELEPRLLSCLGPWTK